MSDAVVTTPAPHPDGTHGAAADDDGWHRALDRVQRPALVAGALGLIVLALGLIVGRARFFEAYLFGFIFWLAVPLGCIALLMLQHLTGGTWGLVIRRMLESGTRLLPLMLLLFVPVALGVGDLYDWTHHDAAEIAQDAGVVAEAQPPVQHQTNPGARFKDRYLTVGGFLVRAAVYFAVWMLLTFLLNKWSSDEDRTGDPRVTRRMEMLSGPGLVLYVLTMTFAAVDWVMSLDSHWYSTIYGILFVVGQGLATLAFVVAVIALLARYRPLSDVITSAVLNDLGNLLLAFTMLWAYISFSQYLIIWSANIPEEVTYYHYRTRGGWQYLALILVAFHFFVPFVLLLWRRAKRGLPSLAKIALLILFMRWVDLFWIVVPSYLQPEHGAAQVRGDPNLYAPTVGAGLARLWTDLAALVGIGGVWIAVYVWQLKRRPLLPPNDPRLAPALELAHGGHHG